MRTNPASAPPPSSWPGPAAVPSEMQLAERVQAGLRPRRPPLLETLEFAGHCLPGRAVGGDFYDFLQPEPGRMTLILGDVSGHGVPAALMMAALQASLRTHYALSSVELGRRIEQVNQQFHECTAAEHYAGLFVGEYDDTNGRLRFANCGHVAPLLLRADGTVERLKSTGTVLGMFDRWNGSVGEVTLAPDDMLVLVTDGILEADQSGKGEFGELRLLSAIMRFRHLEPAALIRAIARDVRLTCGKRPFDDATIVALRAHRSNGSA